MEIKDNIIIFDNDDEITHYCISDYAIVNSPEDEQDVMYYEYPYTAQYKSAIANGVRFHVKDKQSKVMKRGVATKGVTNKKIDNLIYLLP